jgi:hypothetical protein
MVLDLLFALGLLASTASQLRPAGSPVGPGEVCLASWVLLMLTREAGRLGPPVTGSLRVLLTFWTVFALAMCLGTMTGFAIGDVHDPVWFMHDIFAYGLVAAISCLSVVEPGARSRMHRVAWLTTTLGSAWLGLQVAHGWGLVAIGDIDPWEWDRFRGLTDNANQLALFCTIMSLLALHLAEAADGIGKRVCALLCCVVATIVGRLTKSDAFLLALLAAVPVFVVLKLRTWLLRSERKLNLRTASAWICILAVPAVLAYVVPIGVLNVDQSTRVIEEMTRGGATNETKENARLRVHIWTAAIWRGIESGALGLGPGPHLEIPQAILASRRESTNEPGHVEHPQFNFAPNFEAHNTLLDLFVQGGLPADAAVVWLFATALVMTCRARLDAMTALLAGMAVFSIFHLIVRHPIAWFAISFCLVRAGDTLRLSTTPRSSPIHAKDNRRVARTANA